MIRLVYRRARSPRATAPASRVIYQEIREITTVTSHYILQDIPGSYTRDFLLSSIQNIHYTQSSHTRCSNSMQKLTRKLARALFEKENHPRA